MNKQPNFLIIGSAKSGTTTLYHHLRAHPDVFLPDFKEPHYFVRDQVLNFDIIDEHSAYQALFNSATERLIGEASTGYLYFSGTAEKIHRELPNCKIVALIRNPTDRAFSMWSHQIREGLEDMQFEEAVQQELDGTTRHNQGTEFGFNYCRLGIISSLLKEYQGLFGIDNVFIGDYEMLRKDPIMLMNQLYDFLDLDSIRLVDPNKIYNASGNPKFSWLHSFLNSKSLLRRAIVFPLKTLLSERVRHMAWQKLRNWNITSGTRHTLKPETRALLDDYFSDERKALENLIGK